MKKSLLLSMMLASAMCVSAQHSEIKPYGKVGETLMIPSKQQVHQPMKADGEPSAQELLGCPEGTVFGGEYIQGEGAWSGNACADMARPDIPCKFYQYFSDCYYSFNGLRFVGLFNYWDSQQYNWYNCSERPEPDEDGNMTKPICVEVAFYKVGADGMPGEKVYSKEYDLIGENTGVLRGDDYSGYGYLYAFSVDLEEEMKMESGYFSVCAVDEGDNPSCWLSIFTASTSVGRGFIYMGGAYDMMYEQMPCVFCFKGNGEYAAQKAVKINRFLTPKTTEDSKYAKVQVELCNIGETNVNDATLELWDGDRLIATEQTGMTIPSLETYKYTFSARVDCSTPGTHDIKVVNVTPGDEGLADQSLSLVFEKSEGGAVSESSSEYSGINYITNVAVGSISNESQASCYSDFSDLKTAIHPGEELTLDVRGTGNAYIGAWVDWNGNGVFDDSGEAVTMTYDKDNNDRNHYTGVISMPGGMSLAVGDKCLRIISSYYSDMVTSGSYPYGETEDYTITVEADPQAPFASIDNTVEINASSGTNASLVFENTGGSKLDVDIDYSYVLPNAPTASYDVRNSPAKPSGIGIKRMPAKNMKAPEKDEQTQYVLKYDKGQYDVIGITNSTFSLYANYFPSAMLKSLKGMKVASVDVYIAGVADANTLYIYGQKGQQHEGEALAVKDFTPQANQWNRIVLDTPLDITGEDLWFAVRMDGFNDGDFYIGVDAGEAVPGFSDRVNIGYDTWWSMAELGYNQSYCIRANVIGDPTPAISWLSLDKTSLSVESGESASVSLAADMTGMNASLYEAVIDIKTNDEMHESVQVPVYLITDITDAVKGVTLAGGTTFSVKNGNILLNSNKRIAEVSVYDISGNVISRSAINADTVKMALPRTGQRICVVCVKHADGTVYAIKTAVK